MSLFHLYAAVDIVPAQVLRPVHVGFVLLLVFLLFPIAAALPQPADVVGRRAAPRSASRRSPTCSPAATTSGTATRCPTASDVFFGVAFVLLVLEAVPAHVGLDHAVRDRAVPRLRVRRPVAARASGRTAATTSPSMIGLPVPDARGHLRHRGRRVVVAHHPVHDLRRVPAAVGRRQVLPRLELRRDGRQAHAAPAARSCWRRSCWAGRRAPASRRR